VFKTYVNASAGVGGPAGMQPVTSPSAGSPGPGGWTPSVLYMLMLIAAEIVAVGWLSKHL
jgi:hypothetical protein